MPYPFCDAAFKKVFDEMADTTFSIERVKKFPKDFVGAMTNAQIDKILVCPHIYHCSKCANGNVCDLCPLTARIPNGVCHFL